MCVSALGINVPALVSLVRVTLCPHFVAARDAETRRARKQQQAAAGNATAAMKVVLQAQHEKMIRRAGELEGGSRTRIIAALSCYVLKFSMLGFAVRLLVCCHAVNLRRVSSSLQ